jgi:hypothetical protein
LHDPARAADRQEARRRGGRERSRRAAVLAEDTPDARLENLADVAVLLAETINEVRRGQLDARVGNCVAVLAGQFMRAVQGGELEERIRALEEMAAQTRGATR